MYGRLLSLASAVVLAVGLTFLTRLPQPTSADPGDAAPHQDLPPQLFATADACMSCHNGLVTRSGEDISFGSDWQASMMANSARDPYWQAAVRREVTDYPSAKGAIEDECSKCHMPMARFQAHASGQEGQIFANLPVGQSAAPRSTLAADGVSCAMCHQITADNLGTHESFIGGFEVDTTRPMGQRSVFGPYSVDRGRTTVMHSASGFQQVQSDHLQQSEVCATCHTLYTETRGPNGEVVGELPEQVPYLEWRHSDYRDEQSCQTCHMPVVKEPTPIASVLGRPRENVSRHVFRGGNFFMLRMLNRYRGDLGVTAPSQALSTSAQRTVQHLQSNTARVEVPTAQRVNGVLEAEVRIENLAGHKLPTAYPSRRVWIHFTVRDSGGTVVFESGAFRTTGEIVGNDNDARGNAFEPHYSTITESNQVQVYEAIMETPEGNVTTGLLSAARFVKDNRLLPRGFVKATAEEDIAVRGRAGTDDDFTGGSDRVQYRIDVEGASGPFEVRAELWYQPIAYRWAQNLDGYDTHETNRFVRYYESMSEGSGTVLGSGETTVR